MIVFLFFKWCIGKMTHLLILLMYVSLCLEKNQYYVQLIEVLSKRYNLLHFLKKGNYYKETLLSKAAHNGLEQCFQGHLVYLQ